nr:uncharacterized protein CFP56_11045 [Quercus suber]
MNTNDVRNSSTPSPASTLRPRARRLISGLSDTEDSSHLATHLTSTAIQAFPAHLPLDSRSASPIPPGHLSRPGSRQDGSMGRNRGSVGREAGRRQHTSGTQSPNSLSDLWGSSWTAIQGIASDLLGNETASIKDKQPGPRKSLGALHQYRVPSGKSSSQWGPIASPSQPTLSDVGAGTREEQVAAFRAQKRRDMLTRQESSYADALGRFKRRTSDDRGTTGSAPPGDMGESDALVYVHHVAKDDTLAGLTIKYNCSANTLRKANRMWPNDTVQSKAIIILPVDGCSVRGKPVSGPEAVNLLSSEFEALSAGQAEEVPNFSSSSSKGLDTLSRNRTSSVSTDTSNKLSSVGTSHQDQEPPWHHDSWVLFPGSVKPTEIARLSRKSLGYFPPTRRKSNSYSDLDSPSTSLDLVRSAADDLLGLSSHSPSRKVSAQRTSHNRKLSNADNGYFPAYLAGPGGVGTMNKNVRNPGPAQDGLNKLFAKHLPDVAPPRSQQSLLAPEIPLYTDYPTPAGSNFGSGATTPNAGKSLNLENVGSQIESWMRRMATKATQSTERQHAARASVGAPGPGAGGIGDLIEMTNEFDVGIDEEDESDSRRGRQPSVLHVGSPQSTAEANSNAAAKWRGNGTSGSSKARKDD